MAGIYIHIPFCRSKCFYCGFYSTASPLLREAYVPALLKEIELRADYLRAGVVETLYLGGGTPSILSVEELNKIIQAVDNQYRFVDSPEWTLELNPDDIREEKLRAIKDMGFNRLSIGVQSFEPEVLRTINRQHTPEQALRAIETAGALGFDNISIDLILGLPGYSFAQLEQDMKRIAELPVSHVSVYMLSIDSNSVFEKKLQKGELQLETDDALADKFRVLAEHLTHMGFVHYEISNFAKPGKFSRHNTAYWAQQEYLGLGPSAHSYNLHSRQWNVAHVRDYIDALNKGVLDFDFEELTPKDRYNEYIMTSLRTMWGTQLSLLENECGEFWATVRPEVLRFEERGLIKIEGDNLRLTEEGWLLSDAIFSSLFVV